VADICAGHLKIVGHICPLRSLSGFVLRHIIAHVAAFNLVLLRLNSQAVGGFDRRLIRRHRRRLSAGWVQEAGSVFAMRRLPVVVKDLLRPRPGPVAASGLRRVAFASANARPTKSMIVAVRERPEKGQQVPHESSD
jgi:hypothetical protein